MKPIVNNKIVSSLIINGILIATVIVMIIPMIIMLAYSLFQYPESFISPLQFFQETPSFQNYADIFITDTFGRYFVNSLMIAIIVTIGNVFLHLYVAMLLLDTISPGNIYYLHQLWV